MSVTEGIAFTNKDSLGGVHGVYRTFGDGIGRLLISVEWEIEHIMLKMKDYGCHQSEGRELHS